MDTLSTLLEEAYRMGVGVSHQRNPQRLQYIEAEFHQSRQEEGYTPDDEAYLRCRADVTHLGVQLADRAFQNLPKKIRDRAHAWKTMTKEEQEETLKLCMQELCAVQWYSYGQREIPKVWDRLSLSSHGAFPHYVKSWTRGPFQPNCLGIAQMMVGFARATGAEHRVATTLDSSSYRPVYLYYRQLIAVREKLAGFPDAPYVRRWNRRLAALIKETLLSLDETSREMTHHFLIIALADGTAVAVDPYMGAYGQVDSGALCEWRWTQYRTDAGTVNRMLTPFTYKQLLVEIDRHNNGGRAKSRLWHCVAEAFKEADLKTATTRRQREKVISLTLEYIVSFIEVVAQELAAMPAGAVEVMRSEISIGAYTLNHWAVATKRDGGAIAAVLDAQHIVRDQLQYLQEADGLSEWFSSFSDPKALLPELRRVAPQYIDRKEHVE